MPDRRRRHTDAACAARRRASTSTSAKSSGGVPWVHLVRDPVEVAISDYQFADPRRRLASRAAVRGLPVAASAAARRQRVGRAENHRYPSASCRLCAPPPPSTGVAARKSVLALTIRMRSWRARLTTPSSAPRSPSRATKEMITRAARRAACCRRVEHPHLSGRVRRAQGREGRRGATAARTTRTSGTTLGRRRVRLRTGAGDADDADVEDPCERT